MNVDELRRLAADMREAKRYVRAKPAEAIRQAQEIRDRIPWQADAPRVPYALRNRLLVNLLVGIRHALSAPGVLEGYLEAAAFELECAAGPVEIAEVSPDA